MIRIFGRQSDAGIADGDEQLTITVQFRPSVRWIESVEALPGSKPQHTRVALADGGYGDRFAFGGRGVDAVVRECLGDR